MKKFEFSMQSLYDVKVATEKQAQVNYAAAREVLERMEEQVRCCRQQIGQTRDRLEKTAQKGISASDFQNASDYLDGLEKQAKAFEEDASKARAEAEKKREALHEIYRDKKALERICEEQRLLFRKEQALKESKEMEDILMGKMAGPGQRESIA